VAVGCALLLLGLQEAMDAAGLDIIDFVDVGIEVGKQLLLRDASHCLSAVVGH
jgi:hypothetical protein